MKHEPQTIAKWAVKYNLINLGRHPTPQAVLGWDLALRMRLMSESGQQLLYLPVKFWVVGSEGRDGQTDRHTHTD